MNKLIKALNDLDRATITALLDADPSLISWAEASGKGALHYLAEVNVANSAERAPVSLQVLQLFLDRGADMNAVHRILDDGEVFPATPLWYAYARGRNAELVAYLLDKGADPQHCMFAVAWNDDVEGAELFQRYGAEVDPSFNNSTPFYAAYLWRKFAVAEWFLANGANVDFADGDGRTALYHAVRKRFTPSQVQTLLRAGADPRHEDNQGVSPLQVAERNRQHSIVTLLTAPASAS